MSPAVFVHRCRFVDYVPSAITAITFPPLPLPSVKGKGKVTDTSPNPDILAVGRANGNVELHERTGAESHTPASAKWVLRKVLPGPVPSKVDSLVFTTRFNDSYRVGSTPQSTNLRLFSAGGGSEILEWNLDDATILRSISSQAGSVWAMAANPASTLLALGCEDGSVRILLLADDSLIHYRRLDRVKSRVLSIAWGPAILRRTTRTATEFRSGESSEEDNDIEEWADTWLAVGCSDSSLRKYDFASGRVLDRMGTDKSKGQRTLVWAVGVLRDGTIVSGDSLGTVKFWDSNTCTQLQSFQAHNADVLCIAMGPEGRSVYTSGVDQKVCQFTNVQVSTASEGALSMTSRSRWIHAGSRRLHSHDIRALAVWPPYMPVTTHHVSSSSTVSPLLFSGGLDMSLVICPCLLPSTNISKNIPSPIASDHISTFEDAYYLRVPYSTGMTHAVQVASEARLVLCRRDTGLSLWRIHNSASPEKPGSPDLESLDKQLEDNWEKIVDMDLKVQTNLVASAISGNGLWIAASDLYETKLFRLVHTKSKISPKRVKFSERMVPATVGVTSLLFTADSSKLILGGSMGKSVVVVLDITGGRSDSPRILRIFEHHRMQNVIVGGSLARGTKNTSSSETDAAASDAAGESLDMEAVRPFLQSQSGPSVETSITCMAASLDGQWLASADTQHRVHVFNLDSVQHHCALPSFPYTIAALTFDPSTPSVLVIGLANNTLQVFDVEVRHFLSLTQNIPVRLAYLNDPLLGVIFDPAPIGSKYTRRALLWGSSWMCKVILTDPVGFGASSRKRRRLSVALSQEESGEVRQDVYENINSRLVTRYRPVLLVDFLGPGELVVVERPLMDLLSTLPPAYFKPTYGS